MGSTLGRRSEACRECPNAARSRGWRPGRGDNRGYGEEEPPQTLVEVLEGHGDTPPLTFHTLPNIMWHYSSGGYHLLQLLVTDITGASLADAVSELVLGPLEMSATHSRHHCRNALVQWRRTGTSMAAQCRGRERDLPWLRRACGRRPVT